jgi:hypothetical protein
LLYGFSLCSVAFIISSSTYCFTLLRFIFTTN